MTSLPEVAIPSYRRSETIVAKTLSFLHHSRYPSNRITIFVANRDEEATYLAAIPKDLYHRIIVAAPGLSAARNCISAYYPEGEWILQIDDDVRGLKGGELLPWLASAIPRAEAAGAELAGIMPNSNSMNFSDKWTTHLTHIIGAFFLVKNRRSIHCSRCEKEDYERSILYFKRTGAVLRYKGMGVITKYNQGGGGLQYENRSWRMREGAVALSQEHPMFCKMIEKKGMADISLNWRARVDEVQSSSLLP